MTYFNILYDQILIWDLKNFARAPNEYLRFIRIYYIFKYSFRIDTNLL